jgi:hypothetical protein
MKRLASLVRRRPRALLTALIACGFVVVAFACGAPDRPPPLEDTISNSQFPDGSPPPPIKVGPPHAPMCNLGPEGGVCACTDQPLLEDAPNIYFVLDRSGSMADLNKWPNITSVLFELVVALGPRASIGAAIFPDLSANNCVPGGEIFATRRGDAPAGTAGPTVAALKAVLQPVVPGGGTPMALTLNSLLPRLKSLPGKTYVVLATDGGPNCNGSATCTIDQCISNIEKASNCPVAQNCCTTQYMNGPENCIDAQRTVDAVAAIAAAQIPVYIVGVPGSAPYAHVLDQLAQAGGTARGSEPQYYAADTADQATLLKLLSSIAAKITGKCTLELDTVPPDPGLVNVFFDERVVPQMGADGSADGWTLDGTTVTILGASCQKILSGGVLDVRVVAGCPTVTL